MSRPDLQATTALDRAFAYGDVASSALLIFGAFASLFTGMPGVLVMLAGFASSLTIHLVVGVLGYRRVMAREWPAVRPLDEWDD